MQESYFWSIFGAAWVFGWVLVALWSSREESKRREKRLQMLHEERMKAMEKGIPLPEFPELDEGGGRLDGLSLSSANPRNSLGAAAIVTMLGFGLSTVFLLLGRGLRELWPFGLLGLFLGIGLVLNYYLTRGATK